MMQFHFDWLPVMESVSYKLTGHFLGVAVKLLINADI